MAFIVIGLCQLFTLIKFHLLLLLLTEYLNSVSFKKAGILRAKGMDNKLMFTPNEKKHIISSEDKNYWLKSLDTFSLQPNNQN